MVGRGARDDHVVVVCVHVHHSQGKLSQRRLNPVDFSGKKLFGNFPFCQQTDLLRKSSKMARRREWRGEGLGRRDREDKWAVSCLRSHDSKRVAADWCCSHGNESNARSRSAVDRKIIILCYDVENRYFRRENRHDKRVSCFLSLRKDSSLP